MVALIRTIRNHIRLSHIYLHKSNWVQSWFWVLLGHHWFRLGLVTALTQSHYLNVITDWTYRNKIQCNLDQNTTIFYQANELEVVICKMATIFFQLNVLINGIAIPVGLQMANISMQMATHMWLALQISVELHINNDTICLHSFCRHIHQWW